ncbi:MAG: cardiolipin synthase [Lachnospiraceae bacterium]|jgi:cardiolipin synthase|nr:cardiolipin synthase [Lachnospiraceae bacterium]
MKNPKDTVAAKQVKKVLLGRVLVVGLAVLLQFCWLFFLVYQFSIQYSFINILVQIVGAVVVLYIINQWSNPAYKLVWTFVILIFPILGLLIYFVFGRSVLTKTTREDMERVHCEVCQFLPENKDLEHKIYQESRSVASQSKYISDWSDFPVYTNTEVTYYKCGEEMFPDMLKDLERAEHFIFLEYFIIAEGNMFGQVLEILKKKVAQGVDVRLIYDDFGCVTTLPHKYYLQMQELGIKCMAFNQLRPIMSIIMNNRDHRKIFVVDGTVGYTGGLNLADEYINELERFGYWKDTGIRLEGDGVWSFTLMFLEMWNYMNHSSENYMDYHPKRYQKQPFLADGYVQPYGDSPLDGEKVGENVYMNIIGHARDYVYIFTPYLILDNEMLTYLRNAAKSGVDVRIVTPEVPDKKLVFWMSQSYYRRLLECGIRIYQYKPGFIHAKSFVCDDRVATVGSINMDYRSLYLHFECGVWMYRTQAVRKVKEDSLDTIARSREITLEFCKNQPWIKRVVLSVLRLLAPLV